MRKMMSLAVATLALSACGQPAQIYVEKGYVRLPAVIAILDTDNDGGVSPEEFYTSMR